MWGNQFLTLFFLECNKTGDKIQFSLTKYDNMLYRHIQEIETLKQMTFVLCVIH